MSRENLITRADNGQQRPKGLKSLATGTTDALAQFDIVIPDGAYIISAQLQMMVPQEWEKYVLDGARAFALHVSSTDITEGKVFGKDDFKQPSAYLTDLKNSKWFRRQYYGGVKVNIDEPIIFDVTQIIPFELNNGLLFDGTLSFVLSCDDCKIWAYDQRPILHLTLQQRGTSFNRYQMYHFLWQRVYLTAEGIPYGHIFRSPCFDAYPLTQTLLVTPVLKIALGWPFLSNAGVQTKSTPA